MSRSLIDSKTKIAHKIFVVILTAAAFMQLSACAEVQEEGSIPVVNYEDNEILINGEFFAKSERLYINRIDSRVLSMTTDDGYINLDADGNEIRLSDVITNRLFYEVTVKNNVDSRLMMRSAPLFVDYDEMMKTMTSYDEAMKLPFILGQDRVSIIYQDSNGKMIDAATFRYDDVLIERRYTPGNGIRCGSWMTGRIGYGIPELNIYDYKDHWAESSLKINTSEGKTYIWFCIRFEDESDNRTYYSVVVEVNEGNEDEENKYKVIHKEQVPEGFVCCNIDAFQSMI